MFIAMNRFEITPGFEEGFEEVWRNRESFLDDVPGFVSFTLLKGATTESHTLYASHSTWQSRSAFTAWTESENFRKAQEEILQRFENIELVGEPVRVRSNFVKGYSELPVKIN